MRIIVGITGASGVRLSYRMVEELYNHNINIYTIVTRAALKVFKGEGINGLIDKIREYSSGYYTEDMLEAPLSSSSFLTDGMIIIPCTMNTIAKIVHGIADNLLIRAADNQIKMGNKLIIVPRESPLSTIHLRNMYRLSRMGSNIYIVPPLLTYYHGPRDIRDMENYTIGKILDILGVEHNLYRRWSGYGHE